MNVYVESNFILKLAFRQEQHSSCDQILLLCEENIVSLILPVYSLVEPYETLYRRQKNRVKINTNQIRNLHKLPARNSSQAKSGNLRRLSVLLTHSVDEDVRNFERVQSRLLNPAELIPLDAKVVENASRYRKDHEFSKQDALAFFPFQCFWSPHIASAACFSIEISGTLEKLMSWRNFLNSIASE